MNSNIIPSLIIIIVATFLLAAYLGYRKGKWAGVAKTAVVALIALVLGAVAIIVALNLVNMDTSQINLDLIGVLLTVAGLLVFAAILGYLGNKVMGAVIVVVLTTIALIISGVFAGVGVFTAGYAGGWVGLIIGIAIAGLFVGFAFKNISRGEPRAVIFTAATWYSVTLIIVYSYALIGWIAVLTVAIPIIAFFWYLLNRLSAYILPLHEPTDKTEQHKAFRSLVTYSLGTNYPYYFFDDKSQLELRVPGNQFRQFFAGPGFVVTPCDHVAYITNGTKAKKVSKPGITFTDLFDREPRIIDLRPQLRAFPVEAKTKDGFPINVVTFTPYRIDPGDETLELGKPFPFRESAVHKALASEFVGCGGDEEEINRCKWDGGPDDGLVPAIARPIVQDIISRYTIDELCAPLNSNCDPRVDIAAEMRNRVGEAIAPMGLKLIGGGISNLIPQNSGIIDRRLDNWRTYWAAKTLAKIGNLQAMRTHSLQLARTSVDVDIVKKFGQLASRGTDKMDIALALGFIDTLGDIFSTTGEQWPLKNDDLEANLKRLRGENKNENTPPDTRK